MKKTMQALLLMIWSTLALAQYAEVDIRPDDLLSGAADQRLRELGAEAAAEGLGVTVTSPGYWREMIEEQLRLGADNPELPIAYRSTFVESVIVRLGERTEPVAPAAAPAPRPAPVASTPAPVAPPAPELTPPEAAPDRAAAEARLRSDAEAAVSQAAVARPAPPVATVEPEIRQVDPAVVMGVTRDTEDGPGEEGTAAAPVAVVASSDPAPAPEPAPEPAPSEPEAPALATPPPEAPAQAVAEAEEAVLDEAPSMGEAEARASLQRRLNGGRPINKSLSVSQLRRGDQVFVTGGLAVALRPTRIGRNVYWVDGTIDMNDEDLRRVQAGKYDVIGSLDEAVDDAIGRELRAPTVAAASAPAPAPAGPEPESASDVSGRRGMAAVEQDAVADERAEMEARYNLGRPIESTLSPAGLITNDMLYVGDELTVVVRRDKVGLKRYWLVGDLDYGIEELEQAGTNKYRVRRVIR